MDTLQAGITAARESQRAEARTLLKQALQANPGSEQGWLWMSTVVETDAERRTCLERVLRINPNNQTAQAALKRANGGPGPTGAGEEEPASDWSAQATDEELGHATEIPNSTGPVSEPTSPHSSPTLGMDPARPGSRRIRRLAPRSEPEDGIAKLQAAQSTSPPSTPDEDSPQTDPFMALVLIGGLSITAIAGALMLAVLWLIGWPP